VLLDGEPPEIRERTIVTGITDGFRTEIVLGLEEGETVVIEAPDESNQRDGPSFPFGPPNG
ncbi:macrolide transporter, partial [Chloroflexota bacterium]